MHETRGIRLQRLAAAVKASGETYSDDVSALHEEIRLAEQDRWTVREIARKIGYSVAHTHRIMCRLTGPGAAA